MSMFELQARVLSGAADLGDGPNACLLSLLTMTKFDLQARFLSDAGGYNNNNNNNLQAFQLIVFARYLLGGLLAA